MCILMGTIRYITSYKHCNGISRWYNTSFGFNLPQFLFNLLIDLFNLKSPVLWSILQLFCLIVQALYLILQALRLISQALCNRPLNIKSSCAADQKAFKHFMLHERISNRRYIAFIYTCIKIIPSEGVWMSYQLASWYHHFHH